MFCLDGIALQLLSITNKKYKWCIRAVLLTAVPTYSTFCEVHMHSLVAVRPSGHRALIPPCHKGGKITHTLRPIPRMVGLSRVYHAGKTEQRVFSINSKISTIYIPSYDSFVAWFRWGEKIDTEIRPRVVTGSGRSGNEKESAPDAGCCQMSMWGKNGTLTAAPLGSNELAHDRLMLMSPLTSMQKGQVLVAITSTGLPSISVWTSACMLPVCWPGESAEQGMYEQQAARRRIGKTGATKLTHACLPGTWPGVQQQPRSCNERYVVYVPAMRVERTTSRSNTTTKTTLHVPGTWQAVVQKNKMSLHAAVSGPNECFSGVQ